MPGNSGAIRAGKAYYELYADRNPLVKGLKGAEGIVKGSVAGVSAKVLAMGASLAASVTAAVAAVAAPAAATKLFATMGTELTDISRRTGASAAALSTLGYAAKQTGSDLAGIGGLLTTVRDKTMEAARGGDQAQLAFARLGINFVQLSTMKPEDQLRLIADRLKAIPNPALRAAAAAELLGSADMLPTLDRLGELEARAKRLGLTLSNEDATAAKQFDESLTDLWESLKMLGETIGARIAPLLKDWVDTATGIVAQSKDWISSNGALASSGASLWATLKMQWLKGSNFLKDTWDGMTGWIESKWIDTSAEFHKVWASTSYAIAKDVRWLTDTFVGDWTWSIGEMIRGISQAASYFKKQWDETLSWFGKRWVEVRHLAGEIKATDAKTARRAIDAGRSQPPEDDPELKKAMDDIEGRRAAAQKALQDRLNAGKAGRAEAVAELQAELDRLAAEAAEKRKAVAGGAGKGPAAAGQAGSAGALAGVGGALMHVQGIGADDVRTTGGFSKIAASLRQQQNPLVGMMAQSLNLQQEEARDVRRARVALEGLKVRDF